MNEFIAVGGQRFYGRTFCMRERVCNAWMQMQIDYHGCGTMETFPPYLNAVMPTDDYEAHCGLVEE